MRKAIVKGLCVIVMLTLVGCAGFGVWSDTAKAKLDAFSVWANTWVGGALKTAPLIIAGVESIIGQTSDTKMATDALAAAKSALASYNAIVATGSGDPANAQAAVVTAIQQVSTTVGQVQGLIKESCLHPTDWWISHVLQLPFRAVS